MISLRTARLAALISLSGAGMLLASSAFAQTAAAGTDYFSYRAGAYLLEYPEDAQIAQMSSSPLNLIDDSPATDWEGKAGEAVFVLELAEETELSRISFDTAGLNRDRKAPKSFTVELSNTSAESGYEEVLSGSLRMAANNQSFAFKPEERPTGRWVRLTIHGNYGDDYTAFTGFHGYGRATTRSETMPDFTGNYDGNSGLGWMHFAQDGNRLTGCYAYQSSEVTGTIEGRVLRLNIVETSSDGSKNRLTGFFQETPDGRGIRGLVRRNDPSARDAYADYYSAVRTSDSAGGC